MKPEFLYEFSSQNALFFCEVNLSMLPDYGYAVAGATWSFAFTFLYEI
jgi:hypothetical protein